MRRWVPALWTIALAFAVCAGGVLTFAPVPTHAAEQKLTLTPSMVTNESPYGDATMLVDEQTLAGDPANGSGGEPVTVYNPGTSDIYHPASAYIDLGSEFHVTKIYLRDVNGKADFIVSAGTPGNWTQLFVEPLDKYLMWKGHLTDVNTRYIRVTRTAKGAHMSEIVIYGEPVASGPPQKIALDASMITNEVAWGDASLLVDEQTAAGDPANGQGGTPTTKWVPSTNSSSHYFPASAVIDLGTDYDLSEIYLYDSNGTGDVTVSTGTPDDWTVQFVEPMNSNSTWKGHTVNVQSRFVRVTLADAVGTNEIVLYGTALGTPPPPPSPVPHVKPLMEEFIGVNGFIDDPVDKLAVAGHVREYHSWRWDEGCADPNYPGYPNNENAWNPSCAGGGWNFDAYYDALNDLGIEVAPAIQGSTDWISGSMVTTKPIDSNEDPEDPASYLEHADHMFQYAARYGSTSVQDSMLKLASNQPRSTGLDLIRYYENWNEPNDWWGGEGPRFSPAALSAMTSADYDGHLQTLGTTVGVKNADPNAKLVMGGLASLDLEYIRAMKLWSDYHRGGSFPADVINVHHYSNNGGFQGTGTIGISPEADQLKSKVEAIVDYRDRYLPDKELWVSEFGYDTNPGSVQRAPAIAGYTARQVQAQWLVRSYLALAAAGVDKAQMFMLRDVNGDSGGRFNSSGLTTNKATGWQPKDSWYYVYTLKNRLTGMRFLEEQASGNGDVMIYKFKSDAGNSGAYVLWCPTSDGTVANGYQLELQGTPTSALLVQMANGDTDGTETVLSVNNGSVTVNVSESPIFVMVDQITS